MKKSVIMSLNRFHVRSLFNSAQSLCTSLRTQSRHESAYALTYRTFGDPFKVLERNDISKDVLNKLMQDSQVLVKFLCSPINPADINTIQGVYPLKPPLPAFGGNEGLAEVIDVNTPAYQGKTATREIQVGDWVIPAGPGFGTWRSHAIGHTSMFFKILDKEDLDPFAVSQLTVNPCTAYRMLEDFVKLQPDESIIQNGANSGVGINVIQLAKHYGFKTINVIREREDGSHAKVANELRALGADYVITDKELANREVTDRIMKECPKPKLALNCVGGKNATDCMKILDNEGTMVTYGGMSKMPVAIPTGALIFKDQKFKGFWMTRWTMARPNYDLEKDAMLKYLLSLMKRGKLRAPKSIPYEFKDWKAAVDKSMNPGHVDGKVCLVFNELD